MTFTSQSWGIEPMEPSLSELRPGLFAETCERVESGERSIFRTLRDWHRGDQYSHSLVVDLESFPCEFNDADLTSSADRTNRLAVPVNSQTSCISDA